MHFFLALNGLNAHANIFNWARDINYGLRFHLHLYFVYASSRGFGTFLQARRCDKFQNLMFWLISLNGNPDKMTECFNLKKNCENFIFVNSVKLVTRA